MKITLLFADHPEEKNGKLKVKMKSNCIIGKGTTLYSVHPATGSVMRHTINRHKTAFIHPYFLPFQALNDMNAVRKAKAVIEDFITKRSSKHATQ